MYDWVVFLHVLGAFAFAMAHGVSIYTAFRLQKEHEVERVRALLDLSAQAMKAMWGGLLIVLIAGVVAGFMGRWWSQGWIWTAIGILVAIIFAMGFISSRSSNSLRSAVGLPDPWGKGEVRSEPAPEDELRALAAAGRPALMAAIGVSGFIVIVWLMMFKPY
jgi:hypothetical protein